MFVIGLVMPLILTLLALLSHTDGLGGYLLAGMSAIGGVIGIWFFTALGSDGSLTEYSGGTMQVIASASTANLWTYLTLLPMTFGLMSFLAALYRGYKAS